MQQAPGPERQVRPRLRRLRWRGSVRLVARQVHHGLRSDLGTLGRRLRLRGSNLCLGLGFLCSSVRLLHRLLGIFVGLLLCFLQSRLEFLVPGFTLLVRRSLLVSVILDLGDIFLEIFCELFVFLLVDFILESVLVFLELVLEDVLLSFHDFLLVPLVGFFFEVGDHFDLFVPVTKLLVGHLLPLIGHLQSLCNVLRFHHAQR